MSTDILTSLHVFDTLGWLANKNICEFGIEEIKKFFMYLNTILFNEKVDTVMAEGTEFNFIFPSLTLKHNW